MADSESPGHGKSLPVLSTNAKIEALRTTGKPPANINANSLVSRFVDSNKTPEQKAIEEKVIDAIRLVYDPEIPVNIYDLGLIYSINVDVPKSEVHVKMTLTAPGCPVAGELIMQVQKRIEAIEEVREAVVELTWDPPWSREMMSEAAQLELGLM
jgi:FeS assembly SUF system protein